MPCRNLPIGSYLFLDRALGSPHETLQVYSSQERRKVHKDAFARPNSHSSFSSITVFYSLLTAIRSSLSNNIL